MPAIGTGGAGSKPFVTKARPAPETKPAKNYVATPRRASRMFTGVQKPTRSFQQAIQHAARKAAPRAPERHALSVNRNIARQNERVENANTIAQPLKYATKQNIATGAAAQQYRAEHPAKPNFLERIVGAVGKGVHGIEEGAQDVTGFVKSLEQKVTGNYRSSRGYPESPAEAKAEAKAAGTVAAQGALALTPFRAAGALRRGAAALDTARGAKAATLADRELLRATANKAVEGVPKEALANAPQTAAKLKELQGLVEGGREVGSRAGSRALKAAAGLTAGYGKLMVGADVAKGAALAEGEPKPHESFGEKFYHDAIHTIANLPAGTIQGVTNPIATAKAMAKLYADPKQAFHENSFGTLLAFLPLAAGLERGAGGLTRAVTGGRVLSQTRPGIQYRTGGTEIRRYQPGAVSQGAQRLVELPANAKVRTAAEIPGLRKVSPKRFNAAMTEARKGMNEKQKASLTEHDPSKLHTAYLTADGKSGYAIIKTKERLPDGRRKVELVNIFRHPGEGEKGIANRLIRHAIANHGANTLDAFEGPLTRKYGAHGFQTVERQGNWTPGEPDVLYMRHPNVKEATRFQERRDILGSRLGGVVRPGQIDFIRSGERLARTLGVMKGHHFLDKHLPHDEVHYAALAALHEGFARTAHTFWPDIAERVATLKDEAIRKNLTGTDAAHNEQQIAQLVHLEQNRDKISTKDLEHYEKSAGEIAVQQREGWEARNQEGIGEPGQLGARNLMALLTHGHRMGRGDLQYLAEPGFHPYVAMLRKAHKERALARKSLDKARAEVNAIGGKPGPIKTGGVKSGPHFRLEDAKVAYDHALLKVHELESKLSTAEHARALLPGGKRFPGVYDAQGKRVTAAETEAFLKQHFGREMGFITHRQDLAKAQSVNSYGPRAMYHARTGENGMAGAYDNGPSALRNHFDAEARSLASMRGKRMVAEHLVLMGPDGKAMTEANAKLAADNFNRTPGGKLLTHHLEPMVPVPLGAMKTSKLIEGHPFTKELERQGIVEHKALIEEGVGAESWGIAPKAIADRLAHWDKIESSIQDNPLRRMTTPWRQTNLYTSVRWPVGTTIENGIRVAAHNVSPLVVLPLGKHTSISFGTGSHIVKFLDEKISDPNVPHAQKMQAIFHRSQFGTGTFAGSQLHELDPALHDLSKDPFWSKMSENPLNTKGWRPYRRVIGNVLNKMETNAKVAVGGKLAQQDAPFFKKFKQIDKEQAAHDYVEKITSDPAESIRAARNLMEIVGNWNHLTPTTRQMQATWAPFGLWWLNSAKFVLKTLPRDHPYATGLLAAMVTATGQQDRNLKDYLEGTVPLTLPFLGKINLNPVHYSPFDVAGEPESKAASMVLPQFLEPLETLKGTDPLTGEQFATEGSEDIKAGKTGVAAAGSWIPGVRLAEQLASEGGVPTKTSVFPWENEKKLGFGKGIIKTAAPFMFTYDRKALAEKEESNESVDETPKRVRTVRVKRVPVKRAPLVRVHR